MPKRKRQPFRKPIPQPLVELELECARTCTEGIEGTDRTRQKLWVSKLLAFDGNGPIYTDAFCPECGFRGQRATITAADLDDNLFTDEEIDLITQERIHTFLFLITQMLDPEDYRLEAQLLPVLSAEWLGKYTGQRKEDCERHIRELHEAGWLEVARVGETRYKFAFGSHQMLIWAKLAEQQKQSDEAGKH